MATPFPAENILRLFHFAASSVEKGSLTGVSHLNLPLLAYENLSLWLRTLGSSSSVECLLSFARCFLLACLLEQVFIY